MPGEMSASAPRLGGQQLYDALYRVGYHSELRETRAKRLLALLESVRDSLRVKSVLDVGCSHGFAVQYLWNSSFVASGVEISEVAIRRARAARGIGNCIGLCFQQASASLLPFANKTFDAILSSDVLEHLEPADTFAAASEFARVARRALVLSVALRREYVKSHLKTIQRQGITSSNTTLHRTFYPLKGWVRLFAREGFTVIKDGGKGGSHSFVMERRPGIKRACWNARTWTQLKQCGALPYAMSPMMTPQRSPHADKQHADES